MEEPRQEAGTGAGDEEAPWLAPEDEFARAAATAGPVALAFEALLFAADSPLSLEEMRQALPEGERGSAEAGLALLLSRYAEEDRALQILAVAGGYRMTTRPVHDRVVRALYRNRQRLRLGRAALETLAIVAYRQPITSPEIAEIRGKDPSGVLRTLLERSLVRTRGRKRVVGKPFLYGTTREFLEQFGLNSLEDLPSLEEFQAMLGDSQLALPAEESDEAIEGSATPPAELAVELTGEE
jgi:segregation and condensation protein B